MGKVMQKKEAHPLCAYKYVAMDFYELFFL